jgi:dTDP-4-amino-4,6-dideoxygalactose transaminase
MGILDVILQIRQSGTIVIEDITQTMYSKFEHTRADYYVCSFRKWAALPDGGCAISTNKLFSYKPNKTDKNLQEAKLKAFHAKYLYMCKDIGNKDEFLKMFKDAEEILCQQQSIFAMSSVSKMIQANLEIDILREKRRENFQVLCNGLAGINLIESVFNSLPDDVTPLYFPVYVKHNRKSLQSYLAKNDIYAPVIWPKPVQCANVLSKEVDWIYNRILSIPCDQRYDSYDMEKIIKKIMDYDVEPVEPTEG